MFERMCDEEVVLEDVLFLDWVVIIASMLKDRCVNGEQ